MSYRDAGVDIEAGNALVDRIRPLAKQTQREGVLGSIGGFGGLFELPTDRYTNPVLVSGTDGVGTKLKLAMMMDRHDTIGIDLVAMCVNDIIVTGAEPLFFLDYYATGKLELDAAEAVVRGIAEGCRLAGCALSGGETAEMPGLYAAGDYDLAGFAVGIVEKSNIIDSARVAAGQSLLALDSSGAHSNGYSLIRKVLEVSNTPLDMPFGDTTIGEALLEPTQIYVKPILALIQAVDIKAIAHITGGGLPDNLPRVLPRGTTAVIEQETVQLPALFTWLAETGGIEQSEMYRTFNCGVGMVVIVDSKDVPASQQLLQQHGVNSRVIGQVVNAEQPIIRFE